MAVTSRDETEDTSGTKAQDYNSSRSNRTVGVRHDIDDDGRGDEARTGGITAEDDWETPTATTPANHNTTRRSSPATASRMRANDHNSTRSNRARASDSGGIKDGVEDNNMDKRCSATGVDDDCNSVKAPSTDHNTTRSNQ